MNIQETDHIATDLSICIKENFSNFPWFVFGCVLEQEKEELDEINKNFWWMGRWEKARNGGGGESGEWVKALRAPTLSLSAEW